MKHHFFGKTITYVICGFAIEARNKINSEFAIKSRSHHTLSLFLCIKQFYIQISEVLVLQ